MNGRIYNAERFTSFEIKPMTTGEFGIFANGEEVLTRGVNKTAICLISGLSETDAKTQIDALLDKLQGIALPFKTSSI